MLSRIEFENIKQALLDENEHVNEGSMVGLPGIQYRKKNFAFLYKNGSMCFRLGRDFEPQSEGIHDYSLLNPFRNKPPMKDWFVIGIEYSEKWHELAQIALQKIRK